MLNIYAHQAGHQRRVNRQIYAMEERHPMALFRKASDIWHYFILGSSDGLDSRATGTQPGSLMTSSTVVPPPSAAPAARRPSRTSTSTGRCRGRRSSTTRGGA
jgi:hypothetical protein